MTSPKQNNLKFRYPFDGMTEEDFVELFFVEFDTGISNSRILRNIDAEIWKRCDEGIRRLREINEECQKFNYPQCTFVTDDEIAEYQKRKLVYSPSSVAEAVRAIHEKDMMGFSKNQNAKMIHQAAILADRARMDSCPGHYYPIYSENKDYPTANKNPMTPYKSMYDKKSVQKDDDAKEVWFSVFDFIA